MAGRYRPKIANMSSEPDQFVRRDRERHQEQAATFWAMSLLLSLGLLAAFPPTVALGPFAGLVVAGALALATVTYIASLITTGRDIGEREFLVTSVFGTAAIAVDQWLAGGIDAPLQILFTLQILGSAAVLTASWRRVHLAVLTAAVAAPLAYDRISVSTVIAAVVSIALLALEGALLAGFAERLRVQRDRLSTAEREASARALVDPLTGLGNRRALAGALQVAESNSRRTNRHTVMVLDLDGFKAYNDRFGHGSGDALLERLSQALATRLRGRGHAYRLGGDEFCVLLDGTARVGDPMADGIMRALSEVGADYTVEPSCGMAVMPDEAARGDDALRLADERMYTHKRHASGLARSEVELPVTGVAVAPVGPLLS